LSLYKRKDSDIYWMSYVVDGKRERKSTGTNNRNLADKIHAKITVDIEEGRHFENQAKKRTLKEMISRFQQEHTEHRDYYPKARDKSIFKRLYAFFGEAATLKEVENLVGGYEYHRKKKNAKPATILKELGLLRRMSNVARKQWKWKISNPVSDIELPKVRNERVRYLKPDEYTRLMTALDESDEKWLKPFVLVALDTGLRLSNLCNLSWSEVSLFENKIEIEAEKMKNDDYIGIPLTERAYNKLREVRKFQSISGYVFHDNGEKLYDRKVQRAFTKVLQKAGITNFRFHDLRHTFASYLRQRKVDLYTISKLLGHKDTRMTKRYSHLNVDNLREAVSKLSHVLVTVNETSKSASL
jgi:integrase